MHKIVEPKIFYFGTPVVLISTLNEDNSVNFHLHGRYISRLCME
ncbi:hypothetical protein SAMN05518856_1128 [Paenibacillus sp. OK003]|nr:hypothetical protein SAMN05518856_1128 [Paenibacillus sp. OK003]